MTSERPTSKWSAWTEGPAACPEPAPAAANALPSREPKFARARRMTTINVAASVNKLYRVFWTFMKPPSFLDHRGKDWFSTLSPRITCTAHGGGGGGAFGAALTTKCETDFTGAAPPRNSL